MDRHLFTHWWYRRNGYCIFLQTLDYVTLFREKHFWIVNFLPIAGLMIGLVYYYYGEAANKGNILIIETHHSLENGNIPKPIPFKMAPMVLFSTLLTHIVGGSAGRGFVAVFSGATNCVITSIVLGIELFGMKAGIYVGLASVAAYFTSGPKGIYNANLKLGAKYIAYNYFKKIAKL